jgi:DNA-binding response OmpR family regulator
VQRLSDKPLQVLLALSDSDVRARLNLALETPAARPREAFNVPDVMDRAAYGMADAVLLDPPFAGDRFIELCGFLARRTDAVIIVLGAAEPSRLNVLGAGADECVPADCSSSELLDRIIAARQGIQRASQRLAFRSATRFSFAGYLYCHRSRRLLRPDGSSTTISPLVSQALFAFLSRPGERIQREALQALIHPDRRGETADVNVCIHRLRRILADHGPAPRLIETLRGAYRFAAPVLPKAGVLDMDSLEAAA